MSLAVVLSLGDQTVLVQAVEPFEDGSNVARTLAAALLSGGASELTGSSSAAARSGDPGSGTAARLLDDLASVHHRFAVVGSSLGRRWCRTIPRWGLLGVSIDQLTLIEGTSRLAEKLKVSTALVIDAHDGGLSLRWSTDECVRY